MGVPERSTINSGYEHFDPFYHNDEHGETDRTSLDDDGYLIPHTSEHDETHGDEHLYATLEDVHHGYASVEDLAESSSRARMRKRTRTKKSTEKSRFWMRTCLKNHLSMLPMLRN